MYKYQNSEANIFEMVENAYKITLAGAFVPLVMAIIFKNVYTISAVMAMIFGIVTWILLEFILKMESFWAMPPHFFGFIISTFAFLITHICMHFYKKSLQKGK